MLTVQAQAELEKARGRVEGAGLELEPGQWKEIAGHDGARIEHRQGMLRGEAAACEVAVHVRALGWKLRAAQRTARDRSERGAEGMRSEFETRGNGDSCADACMGMRLQMDREC